MMEDGICFYCGDDAGHSDTNIPRALFATVFKVARQGGMDPDLPVCRRCKTIGGRDVFRTPEHKRAHIRAAMISRDGKYLGVADWEEDELEELGYTLQTAVRQGVGEKCRLKRRLAWPRLRPKAADFPDGKV